MVPGLFIPSTILVTSLCPNSVLIHSVFLQVNFLCRSGHERWRIHSGFQRKPHPRLHNNSNSCQGNISAGPSENHISLFLSHVKQGAPTEPTSFSSPIFPANELPADNKCRLLLLEHLPLLVFNSPRGKALY